MMASFKNFLSPRTRFFMSAFLGFVRGSFRQTSFAQNGEDLLAYTVLKNIKNGVYVDVGAHHPFRYSNTAFFHSRGWTGVNIDPNPDSIALFNFFRPKDKNICVGVSEERGEASYHLFSDPAVNTFDVQEAEKWKGKKWLRFLGTKKIKLSPLSEILKEAGIEKVDFLSVDVEGLDLSVLKSNDWTRCFPKAILVEDHEFLFSNPEECLVYNFLLLKGYRLAGKSGFTLLFERLD